MSMCRVFSRVVGRGCLLWPVGSLGKTLLAYALLHFVLQGEICLLLQASLDFLLLHLGPLWWKGYHLQDLLELTPPKDVLFIIGNSNAKVGSQETPGVTGKFGLGVQNESGQRLIEFCQENALVIANTLFQKHKRRLYTWISSDGQYRNQTDYVLCSQRWKSSIQSAKTRPGADCGSDHELLIAKCKLKLKKVGKTTSLFRYDLNQIP